MRIVVKLLRQIRHNLLETGNIAKLLKDRVQHMNLDWSGLDCMRNQDA
jgi:hypothetical protein